MKFKLNKAENPKAGDIRYKYPFAIIPTLCEDGWMVWLERYQITEKYYDYAKGWRLISKCALKDGKNVT